MDYENEFTKFKQMFFEVAHGFITDLMSHKSEEMTEVFKNILLDKPGPRRLENPSSPKEKLFQIISQGYMEIDKSLAVLNDIEVYIKYFPRKSSGASKTRFLSYHITNYMNEVYILRERLKAFHKKIIRLYRNEPLIHEQEFSMLPKLLSSFDTIIKARDVHVHDSRYDDNELDRLGLFEYLSSSDGDTLSTELLYPELLKVMKQKWIKKIKSNNQETMRVLGIYFSVLSKLVFDKNGNLKVPSNYRLGKPR